MYYFVEPYFMNNIQIPNIKTINNAKKAVYKSG